jgi:hypothetical protein
MSQLTIQTQIPGNVTTARGGRRPMRSQRMVSLRSAMPVGLVTLRHDIPERLRPEMAEHLKTEHIKEATPKVDSAERAERPKVDTPVRKGGEAQW